MTNEKIVEEILIKSYELGIYDKVMQIYSELIKTYDMYTSYEKAFLIAISET